MAVLIERKEQSTDRETHRSPLHLVEDRLVTALTTPVLEAGSDNILTFPYHRHPEDANLSSTLALSADTHQPTNTSGLLRRPRWTRIIPTAVATALILLASGSRLIGSGDQQPVSAEPGPTAIAQPATPETSVSPIGQVVITPDTFPVIPPVINTPELPKLNPVDEAIRTGKIELTQPQEWEKYFIMITAEEAQRLLDSNPGSMLFPIDPRNAPNLRIENVEFQMPTGKATVIGISGIPVGEIVRTVASGNTEVTATSAVGGTILINTTIDSGNTHYGITTRRENSTPKRTLKDKSPVRIGTPVFTIGTKEPIGFYPGEQQLIMESYKDGDTSYHNSISQFAQLSGKLAFVG